MDPFFLAFATVMFGALLAAMFPGAGFAMVLKNATSISRQAGIYTALGLSFGVLLHALLVLFGVAYLVLEHVYIKELVRILGASYLIYSGITSLMKKAPALAVASGGVVQEKNTPLQSFSEGFLTNTFNPKTLIFNLAIFAPFIKGHLDLDKKILFASTYFFIEFVWFTLVSTLLTHKRMRALYESKVTYLVKFSGILLLFFGCILFFKDLSIT